MKFLLVEVVVLVIIIMLFVMSSFLSLNEVVVGVAKIPLTFS